MSFFKRLIGSESTKAQVSQKSATTQAIDQLASVEEMLVKRQEHLEGEIEKEKRNALNQSKQGNKRGALNAMRKKKQHEKTLAQIDGTLTTIEMQRDSLHSAASNAEIFKVMGNASKALQKVHADLDVDKVHEIMDDIAEQNDLANEISNALSSGGLSSNVYDNDELERELEMLAADENAQRPIDASRLPTVPDTPIRTKATGDQYRELEAWMS